MRPRVWVSASRWPGAVDELAVLATTVLTVAGTFTIYTYLGVFPCRCCRYWAARAGADAFLLGFGLASAAGARLGGIMADQWRRDPSGDRRWSLTVLA